MKRLLALLLVLVLFSAGCVRVKVSEGEVEVKVGGIEVAVGDADEGAHIGGGTVDPAGIEEIRIDWVSGSIEVTAYDGDAIEIEENAKKGLSDAQKLRYRIEDDELSIEYCKPHAGAVDVPSKKLTVRIPKSMLLDKLRVTTVSAEAAVETIDCDELRLITVSADVTVSGGAAKSIDAESVSGDILLRPDTMPKEIDLDAVSGSLELTLPAANDGFALELDSVSGDLISDAAVTVAGDRYILGNGACEIDCETVSGNVKIK